MHLGPLRQLILHSAVHAVAVGGNLLDLKGFLSQFLSQLHALLVPHTLEILHFGLCDPAIPLLLLSCFLVLEGVSIKSIHSNDKKQTYRSVRWLSQTWRIQKISKKGCKQGQFTPIIHMR